MSIFSVIGSWFKSKADKAKEYIKKAWALVTPFLKQVLTSTASYSLSALQELAIEAVKYVSEQGLPTDDAKREAFAKYMKEKSEGEIDELKDYEIALLRETALAIWKQLQK